jgi:hypothetical protein
MIFNRGDSNIKAFRYLPVGEILGAMQQEDIAGFFRKRASAFS